MLPGNHDVNIVDRANPARLDLSLGPNKPAAQDPHLVRDQLTCKGRACHVVDRSRGRIGETLTEALRPHAAGLTQFAETGLPGFLDERAS